MREAGNILLMPSLCQVSLIFISMPCLMKVMKGLSAMFFLSYLQALPLCFVKEHGNKFKQWVILRTLSSTKPWRVRLSVQTLARYGSPEVRFEGGWSTFAAANRLKEGDSLIFALIADAMSEFRVYIFRGVTAMPASPHNSYTPRRSKLRRLAGDGNMTQDDLFIGEEDAVKVLNSSATVT